MSKPLKFWSLTVSFNYTPFFDHERLEDVMNEFTNLWCFQLERGGTNGKLHYQCRVIMHEATMKPTLIHCFNCRGMDQRDITFLPETNKSIEQGGLSFYVMKDETREAGPWMDDSYVPTRKEKYLGLDLKCMETPRPFQQTIMDWCSQPSDDRSYIWIWNATGCAGKSKLMKYMRFHRSKWDMHRVPMGSAIQIKTSIIEKGKAKIYMVNIPRVRGSDERQAELFSALEEIKDGWVESPMYGKGQELIMEPPHVIVFSNELPNFNHASPDRIQVWNLSKDDQDNEIFRQLTINEAINLRSGQFPD